MLKIKPQNYQFCPFCGGKLEIKIEENHERKFCGACKWTYYPNVAAAAGAVIVKGSKVLLVKRARDPYRGTWMFPAGYIEFGEHPEETVAREVKEETGLKMKEATFLKVVQTKDDYRSPGHFMFFYRVSTSGKNLETDKEENQDIAWIDIKNPPQIGWKSHKYIMKMLQNKLI